MTTSAVPLLRVGVPAAALLLLALSIPASGQSLRAYVVGAGGATMSNGSFQLRATLGQPVAGRMTGSAQSHKVGFWYLAASEAGTGVPVEDDATPEASGLPDQYRLEGNYPNPFNPQTTIRYALPEPAHVRMVVYDAVGRPVRVLVDRREAAGWHTASFAAAGLPSGTYFYRLEAAGFREVRSMLLVK